MEYYHEKMFYLDENITEIMCGITCIIAHTLVNSIIINTKNQ